LVVFVANSEDICCCNACCLVEQGREMFVRRPNGSSSVTSDPGERYIRVPGVSNSSSYDVSATSAVSSPLQSNVAAAGSVYSSVFPVEGTSTKDTDEDSGDAYIRLEDCYSGQPVSSLPVYSAARGRPTVSPSKDSKQMLASVPVNVDAANHHRVEYCNDYERGEHGSLSVANSNYTGEIDDDDSDSNNNDIYSHYQYPTVHYSTCHGVISELCESGSSSVKERYYQDPDYVNCSYLSSDLYHDGSRESCPAARRYGICCGSELSKLSGNGCTHASAGWSSCRFIPSTAEAVATTAVADDDDDLHDYVNVPLLNYSHIPFLL